MERDGFAVQYENLANFNITCNDGGFFASPKGEVWSLPPRSFSQNKFYFFTKGECSMTVGDITYSVRAGDWIFIPAYIAHSSFKAPEYEVETYWMHFETYPEIDILDKHLGLPHLTRVPPESDVFRLFSSFFGIYENKGPANSMAKKSLLFGLLSEYIYLAYPEDVPSFSCESDTRIEKILQYIRRHIKEPLSVTTLATILYMHPNHFIRFFKEKTGVTPARYIKTEKMRLARELLLKTDMPVVEIMETLGHTSPCIFSRQFKTVYSLSPREFRRYHKRSDP